ncbi:MAG: translation initiation factor IF-6 [Candidatus Micrarchaeota archaeon]|nr:translation initiation factor IF-6 [Candidatus Micrarchaeota archaeon]
MEAAKHRIGGSDHVGVFATATDKHVFLGIGLPDNNKELLEEVLGVSGVRISLSSSSLVGLFSRANSRGVVLSSLTFDEELQQIRKLLPEMIVEIVDSDLNAVGSNILTNDRIAIVNPDFDHRAISQIRDILDVEIVKREIGGFKTVGANNILTNRGFVINNRSTDEEKEELDKIIGFSSVRTTANKGSLALGLSAVANSNAVLAGDSTTGYELSRIVEALEQK